MATETATQRLKVKVFSPYQVFFQGSAVTVSAETKTGPFDVLYKHTNFFALLLPGRVKVNTGFELIEVEIQSGVIRVADNVVTVFANV